MTDTKPKPRLYFAYGSNLSVLQMAQRCPSSTLYTQPLTTTKEINPSIANTIRLGPLARLPDHKWVISPRGYANVLSTTTTTKTKTSSKSISSLSEKKESSNTENHNVTYGLLWALTPEDEESLDGYEGVTSGSYYKTEMSVQLLPNSPTQDDKYVHLNTPAAISEDVKGKGKGEVDSEAESEDGEWVKALVYVDPREGEGKSRDEYVGRMNRGLKDAIALGISQEWVDEVIRPFIPAE